jgi:hypothetical protein
MSISHTNELKRYVVSVLFFSAEILRPIRRRVVGDHFHDMFPRAISQCEPAEPANTVTDRLNKLLQNGGDGYVLFLCPNQTYSIQAPISFAHPNQEISTLGYPTGIERAVLTVSGPISDHTTAISGTCSTCNGVILRNVQVILMFLSPQNRLLNRRYSGLD